MAADNNRVTDTWRSAAQLSFGSLLVALLTFVGYRLGASAPTVALLYMLAILLVSLQASVAGSVLASVVAVLGLDYFFTPPLFRVSISSPIDILATFTFGTTAVVVTGLLAKLRRSEHQWRDVFENNPTMYFIVDAAGNVLSVNPFGAQQLGYTVNELVGQPVLNVFYEPDRDAVQKHVASCLAHVGNAMSWELRKIRKDGSMLWVRETAKAVLRTPTQPIVLVACEDITERKRAEEELRRSQAYLAEAQRLSQTGSFGWNAVTGEIVWSDETYRIVGIDRSAKPTLDAIFPRIHADDAPRVRQALEGAAGSGDGFDLEHRLVMPAGSIKYLHLVAHPVRDDAGNIEFVGAAMDVTEQRRARGALEKALDEIKTSEDRLRRTIDSIPGMVWSAQPDGAVDFVNRRWIEFHGLSLDEARGSGWQSVVHPDEAAAMAEQWTAATSAGAAYEQELRARRRDGTYRWFLTRAVPQRDETGQIVKWYGTSTDIDDRKRAEEGLREARDELARVVRLTTMGELAASIAHEIRQPLAAIVMNGAATLRWLNRAEPDLDEARNGVSRIVRDAGRAEEVIRGLRTLAQKSGPRLSPLNLTEAIQEVLTLSHGELHRQGVSVHLELDQSGRPVVGDRVQLQQVLLNLLMNGVEAMSGITDHPKALTIRSEAGGENEIVVSVEDTGPGLDPASAGRLFEPFFTTKPNGLGMGLSIGRSIIDAHGGRLWVEPRSPSGTAFRFTVPVAEDGGPQV